MHKQSNDFPVSDWTFLSFTDKISHFSCPSPPVFLFLHGCDRVIESMQRRPPSYATTSDVGIRKTQLLNISGWPRICQIRDEGSQQQIEIDEDRLWQGMKESGHDEKEWKIAKIYLCGPQMTDKQVDYVAPILMPFLKLYL
jgi:hypothetical protein